MAKIKVVLLGHANVGKTSIGKYLKYFDRALALDTEPSTRIEKYMLKIMKADISLFVTPGQKRFKDSNMEFLLRLLDSDTIVIYVIDASTETNKLKLMVSDFIAVVHAVRRVVEEKKIGRINIVLLAHKQDLPGAIDGEKVMGRVINRIRRKIPFVSIEVFNTSIYYPESIFRFIRKAVIPKVLPISSIHDIVTTLTKITGSDTVVISDSMGFPIAIGGEEDIGTWLAIIPAKMLYSLDHEKDILRNYRKNLWASIYSNGEEEVVDIIMELGGSKSAYISIRRYGNDRLCISMYNPKKRIEIIRGVIDEIGRRVYELIARR